MTDQVIENAKAFREKIELAAASVDDYDATEIIDLFKKWSPSELILKDERRQYEGKLYKALQEHFSQEDWTPDVAVSLWVEVSNDPFPPYRQPTGASDAYMRGDGCTWNNDHYICVMDGTVWSPDVAPQCWEEVA